MLTVAGSKIAVPGGDGGADFDSRVEACRFQEKPSQSGGGRFAVGAGDTNDLLTFV